MRTLWQDIRYGFRMLWKSPGFTLVAVITLALGICANTTIFSFANALLLRPLPGVEDPHRLVAVYTSDYSSGRYGSSSYPDYLDFSSQSDVFSGLAAYSDAVANLIAADEAERVGGTFVTGNYFTVLGVKPVLGRLLMPEDNTTPGAHPVIVISRALWERRFGSDPAILGKTLILNGRPYTIVGVASESFRGLRLGSPQEFWVPMMMESPSLLKERGSRWLGIIGRLKPRATLEQAQAQISTIGDRLARAYPQTNLGTLDQPDQPRPMTVETESRIGPQQRSMIILASWLLIAAVGFVLLIACANVANLLLARAAVRRREIAIRLALGASRLRLVQQLLTESMLLALIGGTVGLLATLWTADFIPSFFTASEVGELDTSLDQRVLSYTLLVSLLTGVLFGLMPALQATRPNLLEALKTETGGAVRRFGRFELRNMLVIAQVALSLVLLICAGLFVRSLRNAVTADFGFDPRNVMLASVNMTGAQLSKEQGKLFYQQLQERVGTLPGVRSVSLTRIVPISGGGQRRSVRIEGYQPKPNEDRELNTNVVGLNYFQTMGIPILQGRDFSPQDTEEKPGVVVVNEEFARRYFPGQNPIGKRLRWSPKDPNLEIVGVVKTAKYRKLREDPLPFIYIPLAQEYQQGMTLLVRTASEPLAIVPAVRAEIKSLNKYLPVFSVKTMTEHIGTALAAERMMAVLLGVFGFTAMLLAAIGIYGVIAYGVTQRTREIGIRIALGAQAGDVLKLIVGHGLKLTLIGILVGLVGSFALTRVISSLLYGVSATDPVTFAVISLSLTTVALLASYIPARRATKVDPMVALRYE